MMDQEKLYILLANIVVVHKSCFIPGDNQTAIRSYIFAFS